ncbi:MAG: hypothetical protein GYA24_01345 [Candidatus Lokiarchaeota archaeon]|nr:hypothetical protein [Candidatus Lokiarchaeota archaeon]
MKLSFQREMIDSLKEKIRASRQEKQLVGGIVAMYLLVAIPLGFYLLLQALLPGQPATQAIQTFSPVISALAIAAPFFLALGTIKLLGEKKPAIFGRICTALFPRSKASLKHIATRNISSKASKIARISMIVLFTIAFGFCVKVTFDSLIAFRMEKMRILVGNDISGSYTGSIAELNDTRVHIATMPNVTRSSSYIETYCMVINNDDPFFTYQGFNCNLMNLSEYIAAISTRNDKYLHEATWAGLLQAVAGNPDVVVLPSSLKSHVHGPTLTIKIPYYTGSGYGYFTKQYTIAGYYKVFPGVVVESQSLYYDIIVNENPWIALQHETNYLTMTTCIDTLLVDQGGIDDFAARMNFTTYKTMSNMTDASGLIGMMPLVEMPIFYNLLDIDSWLALSIALFGIAVISFMRINAERKEIGLYRIRGFDATMLFTTQLAEKYVPILIGGIVGVGAGIASGWLAATSIALNFQAFNPVVNYPMEFVITGGTILLQAIIPLVLYLAIIMLAIKNEIRQELGNIMDEED